MNPLRKILVTFTHPIYGSTWELLECQHEQRARGDIMGPYRRRCKACGRDAAGRPPAASHPHKDPSA